MQFNFIWKYNQARPSKFLLGSKDDKNYGQIKQHLKYLSEKIYI